MTSNIHDTTPERGQQTTSPEPQSPVQTEVFFDNETEELASATPGEQQVGVANDVAHVDGHPVHDAPAPGQHPMLPSHEWTTARYAATNRQMYTLQSLSVARNINLPFIYNADQPINRAGASRLIQMLIAGQTPSQAVIDYILNEGVDPEPTEPFEWPNGGTDPCTDRQQEYIRILHTHLGTVPPAMDNLTQAEAHAKITELRAAFGARIMSQRLRQQNRRFREF